MQDYGNLEIEQHYSELGQRQADYYRTKKVQSQIGAVPCSTEPGLCPFETLWQAQWKGIPSFTMEAYRPMYKRDERAWQTDLDSIKYERSIETGMLWDPYRFMDGPQMLMQYLNTDLTNERDQYMRQVHSLET
jgi:hypothetical protein